jgi:serine/threonine protein kinase
VYEAGDVDGRHYIATEFVDGTTLAERIAHGGLPWKDAVSIAISVGQALIAAHSCGIVHRDVKPGNILLGKDGSVKLTDFGIAKLAEQGGARPAPPLAATIPGIVIGTANFMSPEQAAGLPIDHRSDIWNLAMVLREMLASSDASTPTVPATLRLAINRGLETDPDRRFANMRDFVNALESVQRSSQPAKIAPQVWIIAAILLCLIGVGLWQALRRAQINKSLFRVAKIVKLTSTGKVAEAAICPDSRHLLYVAEETGKRSIRLREVETNADTERLALSDLSYTGITFAPNGDSFYYLVNQHKDERALFRAPLIGGPPVKLIDDVDSPVAVSPDGRWLEFERDNPDEGYSALYVALADGSAIRKIATRRFPSSFLVTAGATWTSDGKSIVAAAIDEKRRIRLISVRVSDGTQRQIASPLWRWLERVNRIPNSNTLVFAAAELNVANSQLYQLSPDEGSVHPITSDLSIYLGSYTSENTIVTLQQDRLSAIWTTSLAAPPQSVAITPPTGRYYNVASLPDGSFLTAMGNGRERNIWRVSKDGSMQQITHGAFMDGSAVVSADGKSIAFLSNRGGGWHLWICDSAGQFLRQLTFGAGSEYFTSFAPDGSIVFQEMLNGSVSVSKVSPDGGSTLPILPGAQTPVLSPSGEYLACEMEGPDSKLHWVVVNVETSKVVRQFPEIPLHAFVRWTADGEGLAYIETKNSVSNIALARFAKESRSYLTNFNENMIFSFDMSRDGRELALVRGMEQSDIVLLQRER